MAIKYGHLVYCIITKHEQGHGGQHSRKSEADHEQESEGSTEGEPRRNDADDTQRRLGRDRVRRHEGQGGEDYETGDRDEQAVLDNL